MDKTLFKALRILELLAQSEAALGVTEVANALRLSKSSVHRPLTTLVELGYAARDPEASRYTATVKLWEVGSAVVDRLDLKKVAAGPMAELAKSTGETVHLSILSGLDVIHLAKIECAHPLRVYSRVGGRVPAHCIATGKAMLAFQSDDSIKKVTANLTLATPDTVVDPKAFLRELDHIRRTRVAVSCGAWQQGVNGVAAPIMDVSGEVFAGIGISGPALRLRAKEQSRYAPAVIAAAENISRGLGYVEPQRRNRLRRSVS